MSMEQRKALDAMLREEPQPSGRLPVERMREGFARFMRSFPVPAGVRGTPTKLADRPAVVVEPDGDARAGTILYLHGGSCSLGSPETAMVLTAHLVRRTGVRAISLDYRLAPESTRSRPRSRLPRGLSQPARQRHRRGVDRVRRRLGRGAG